MTFNTLSKREDRSIPARQLGTAVLYSAYLDLYREKSAQEAIEFFSNGDFMTWASVLELDTSVFMRGIERHITAVQTALSLPEKERSKWFRARRGNKAKEL